MAASAKGNRVRRPSQTKPFGASIFDNWMKRRIALHDTGRETRLRIIDASARNPPAHHRCFGAVKPFGARVLEMFQPDAPPNFTTEITETALRTRKGVGERIPFGTTQPPPCRRRRFRAFRGTNKHKPAYALCATAR